jgi:hypothetical protein
MRSFGTVKPTFWNGATGRAMRDAGADVQLLALYLLTNPHANMIGLYYLPLVFVRTELAMSMAQIIKSIDRLTEFPFALYDKDSEMVWVIEMARYQLGDALQPHDHRVKALGRIYREMPDNVFLSPFFDRYGECYHMPLRRGLEGASIRGLAKPLIPVPDPDPVLMLKEEEGRDRFERFWRTYPKRKGKDAAWRAWQKRDPDDVLTETIIAAVQEQMRDPQWIKEGGQYIPHPATWLNAARWQDEPVEVPNLSETTLRVVKGGLDYAAGE